MVLRIIMSLLLSTTSISIIYLLVVFHEPAINLSSGQVLNTMREPLTKYWLKKETVLLNPVFDIRLIVYVPGRKKPNGKP